jgi:hypothetical protein
MKRFNSLPAGAALIALLVSASACDNGLAGLNDNPNAPTDVDAAFLLPQALKSTIEYGNQNTWFTLEFTGSFVQHWAKIQYTDEDRYELRPNVVENFWSGFYAGALTDWQRIIEKSEQAALVLTGVEHDRALNQEAIGRIGKAFAMHLITDIWGDVPYTEALRAPEITAPKYDSQESIYTALLAELESAAAMMNPGAPGFGAADLIYSGDVARWQKFANSLRLRLAMRLADVAPSVARPIVEALATRPLILSNADNFTMPYLSADPNQNPLYRNRVTGNRDDHSTSNTLINLMGALEDPRIGVFANAAAVQDPSRTFDWCGAAGQPVCHVVVDGQVYRGMRNGVLSGDVPEPIGLWSRIGDYFRFEPATPQPLLTAAEVNFLLAEAALRGWAAGGSAQSFYEAGIRVAFDMWNGANDVDLGAAVQNAYLTRPGVAWNSAPADGAGNNFELIAEQKWLALYTNGPEAYAEYRRTGYPDEIQPSQDAEFDFVPRRIPYPDIEQSLNAQNRAAAITAQSALGVDGSYRGRVWWAKP